MTHVTNHYHIFFEDGEQQRLAFSCRPRFLDWFLKHRDPKGQRGPLGWMPCIEEGCEACRVRTKSITI